MSAIRNFTKAHGCGCGKSGEIISRRSLQPPYLTRKVEIEIQHFEPPTIHVNEYDPFPKDGRPRMIMTGTR